MILIVDDSFYNPDQLKLVIDKFDIVLSTRMHFAIQSLSIGIPVLPIAYEFKTKELFKSLVKPECILDIDTITPELTLQAFKILLDMTPESRKELFLWLFEREGTNNPNNTRFQFWQQHNHPVELAPNEMIDQRVDYIHNNPVEAGIVHSPEHYLYSSAINYTGLPEKLIDVILI